VPLSFAEGLVWKRKARGERQARQQRRQHDCGGNGPCSGSLLHSLCTLFRTYAHCVFFYILVSGINQLIYLIFLSEKGIGKAESK
jgi:hypothetical protein